MFENCHFGTIFKHHSWCKSLIALALIWLPTYTYYYCLLLLSCAIGVYCRFGACRLKIFKKIFVCKPFILSMLGDSRSRMCQDDLPKYTCSIFISFHNWSMEFIVMDVMHPTVFHCFISFTSLLYFFLNLTKVWLP